MQYILMTLFAAATVALDQLTKYLVVQNIPLHTSIAAVPGVFELTYVQNTGAAFSMLQGAQWLFLVIFILLTAGLIWEFSTKKLGFTTFERWCLVAIYAGGLGNMLDRLRLGYVVDMVKLTFMDFAVFNVADSFITCGCILLLIHLVFFNRGFWKDGKK